MQNSKVFCNGLFCRKTARKYKCVECKTILCGKCVKYIKNKSYCPDCYITKEVNTQWKELKQEATDFRKRAFWE